MSLSANEAGMLLKAMSNRYRLLMLCLLIEGEKSVSQLADRLGIRRSAASQHLALLRRDRIVSGRRDGQTVWYRIASRPARDVMRVVYAAYCDGSEGWPAQRRN